MANNATGIISAIGILLTYLYVGYLIVKSAMNGLGDNQGFEWSWKVVGEIIGWLPLLIISYICLKLFYNKMQPGGDPTKIKDED